MFHTLENLRTQPQTRKFWKKSFYLHDEHLGESIHLDSFLRDFRHFGINTWKWIFRKTFWIPFNLSFDIILLTLESN